jgi:4-amino-4-deoxychorismate lyase
MSRFFETIRIDDGVPLNLAWHEQRMEKTMAEFRTMNKRIRLMDLLTIPPDFSTGIVRCNVIYSREIEDVVFKPYFKKIIRSLKLVHNDMLDYHVKYTDRTTLEILLAGKGDCDEVLIVKHGLITDTSMSNIIFFDGINWYTPARPLLNGTCRERLLCEGTLKAIDIRVTDLHQFTGCKLINAMRFPEEEKTIMISNIVA